MKNKLKELEKAYGGCHKCYGKGYATEMVGHMIASGDFEGELDRIVSEGGVKMRFCSCARGEQLKELVDAEVIRAYKEGRKAGRLFRGLFNRNKYE